MRKDPWEVAETIGGEYQHRGPASIWPFSLMDNPKSKYAGENMIEEIQDYKYGQSYPGEEIWGKKKGHSGESLMPKPDRPPMSMEETIAALEAKWDQAVEDDWGFSEFEYMGIYSKEDIRRRIELGFDQAKGPVTDTGIMTAAHGGRIGAQ